LKLVVRFQYMKRDYCMLDVVTLEDAEPPACSKCHGPTQPLLNRVMEQGKIVIEIEPPAKLRERVLAQIERIELWLCAALFDNQDDWLG